MANWKYGKLLEVFGAQNPRTFRVEMRDELAKLLSDKEFAAAKDIQVHYKMDSNTDYIAR